MPRFALLALLAACGSKAPVPAPAEVVRAPDAGVEAAPEAFALEVVAEETRYVTPWGATIVVPAGWYLGTRAQLVRVQAPEQDLTATLLISDAPTREEAFAEAWSRVDPAFELPIGEVYDLPGEDGWEAQAQAVYVTPSDQQRAVIALGRRFLGFWHVALLDGSYAALDRRGAQLQSIILDLEVPGLEKESWADKVALLGDAQLEALDAFVEQARVQAGIPGAALAVVKGGKVVLEKGYGKRGTGKKAKAVEAGTAFLIGSTTKSLTTVMMARLVDDQALAWDTKIVDLLPSFALGDAQVTEALTLEHTVCACTGMPRQDLEFLFEYGGWTPEQRLDAMKTMVPTTGFGETFQYSNSLVAVGGYAAAHAYAPAQQLGPAYDAAMQALVFDPLGMKSTTLDFAKAQKGNWARPTARELDRDHVEFPPAYETAVSALRPAGGVWSTAHDMAQYLLFELAGGKSTKGKQVVSTANLLHRRDPQVKISAGFAYGLGVFVSDEHGVPVIHHGGNMLGYTSDLAFFPGADLGYVLLTNAGGANAFRDAVRGKLLELIYEAEPESELVFASELEVAAQAAAEQVALLATPDEAFEQRVIGVWTNPALGTITLRKTKGALIFDAGEWQSTFTKMVDRDGAVKLITTGPPYAGFVLRFDDDRLVLDAGQQTYELVRTP